MDFIFDVHTRTAAEVFDISEELVTTRQRDVGKAVNFVRRYDPNWATNPRIELEEETTEEN